MKKFLSLVLALVMTMSLVTVSAGAEDFTDDSSITYEEAVDVMSAVDVIDGYTDGSFQPTTLLTRGAAAKIICNLILGPTTAAALGADTAPYSDVPTTNVFAGYIAYCQKEGIISGYADGTFRPAAPLTGYAFMKMLLGALGYDSVKEGYTGANWSINVAKQAIAIGLDDGNDEFVGQATVNREEAMLYAFNTMKATMVTYGNDTTITVGDTTISTSGKATEVGQGGYDDIFGGAKASTLQFCEKYFKDLTLTVAPDDFGRPSNTWKVKKVAVGTYAAKGDLMDTYTAKVTQGTLYDLLGKSVYDDLKDATDSATLNVYVDGANIVVDSKNVSTILPYIQKNSSDAVGKGGVGETGNGVVTEVYLNSDNDVTIVIYHTWVFQAAEDYNAKKETVKIVSAGDTAISLTDSNLSADDFDIADIKEDDYLLVTATVNGTKYDVQSVDVAEVVSGTVNSYKNEESITLNNEEYKYSNTTVKTSGGVAATQYTVGQTAAVVLDAYGYVIEVDEALVSSNYVFIAGIDRVVSGLVSSAARADAYYTDGTAEEIVVDKIITGGTTITSAAAIATSTYNYKWYTYSKTTDGKIILLDVESKYAAVDGQYAGTGASKTVMENSKVAFMPTTDDSKTIAPANDATIVMVRDTNTDASVYTGLKAIPDIKLTASAGSGDVMEAYTLKNTNTGYTSYVFVDAYGLAATDVSIIGGDENAAFVYVVQYDGQYYIDENNTYYTYKVLDENGDVKTVKADSPVAGTGDIFDLYYKARTNADEEITSLPAVPNSGKYIDTTFNGQVSYADGVLTLGTAGAYTLASDAQIVLVTLKASGLNKDPDAKYEVATGLTGKTLANALKGYAVSGAKIAGATTEANNKNISTLYVTVGSTTPVAPSNTAEIVNVKMDGVAVTTYATAAEAQANPIAVAANATIAWTATVVDADNVADLSMNQSSVDYPAVGTGNYGTGSAGVVSTLTVKAVAVDGTIKTVYVAIKAATTYAITDASSAVSGMTAVANKDNAAEGETVTVTFAGTPDVSKTYTIKANGLAIGVIKFESAVQTSKDYQFTMPASAVTLSIETA